MREKFNNYLFIISAIAVLCSAALYMIEPHIMAYIFAVGAAGMAIARLSKHETSNNLRAKRLFRLQKLASLIIVFASYMMFKPGNQWVPLLLIAAFLELYTSIVLSKIESKE